MIPPSHLLFRHKQFRFAMSLRAVREIVWMAELNPLAEAPACILGALNLRGHALPVVDLSRRWGEEDLPLHATDQVVVVQEGHRRVGIRVDYVDDMVFIDQDHLQPVPDYGNQRERRQSCLNGIAEVGTELVMVLDEASVVELTDEPGDLRRPDIAYDSARVQEILHERARLLANPTALDAQHEQPLAIFELCGELFALEATQVLEFSDVGDITPVPGAPPHLAGLMYFRGRLLTVIDLRGPLGLTAQGTEWPPHALLLAPPDRAAALLVDRIVALAHFPKEKFLPFPGSRAGHVTATMPYDDRLVSLLDGHLVTAPGAAPQ